VTIASPRLGLVAKLDRIVRQDGAVIPVETGRPKIHSEIIQVCHRLAEP